MEFFKKYQMNKKGFTLVEMLVAMAIFVTFVGVLLNSYTSIVRSQREANDYRAIYVEGRETFDFLIEELRDGMVDYAFYDQVGAGGQSDDLMLVSKDAQFKTFISYDRNNDLLRVKKMLFSGEQIESFVLNSDIAISDFAFYVSPAIDPYDQDYFNYDRNQFHPKVTVFAEFEEQIELQTTVSSRIYNQIYEK